jgi:NAD(P)-dependent dehydrogenase (short-subunit alcohol dehydrogenase family)
VVVGATSGVGRALARGLARAGQDLVIAARDRSELEIVAADLIFRHGRSCHVLCQDIDEPAWDAEAFAAACVEKLGGSVDGLFVPAGGAREDDWGPNPDVVAAVAGLNFVGPAKLGAAFARRMQSAGGGVIVFVSSIAAAAPRSENSAYSAAKAALEVYARGLRHALESSGVRVITAILGYVDTPQSFGRKFVLPVATPEAVAERLIQLSRGPGGTYHVPPFWWLVPTTLRALPWGVYRHLFRK